MQQKNKNRTKHPFLLLSLILGILLGGCKPATPDGDNLYASAEIKIIVSQPFFPRTSESSIPFDWMTFRSLNNGYVLQIAQLKENREIGCMLEDFTPEGKKFLRDQGGTYRFAVLINGQLKEERVFAYSGEPFFPVMNGAGYSIFITRELKAVK